MLTEEIEDDSFTAFKSDVVLDNEEVTLYLNVMGEYVAVSVAEDASSYQFGIVTDVITGLDWDLVDDEEYAVRTIRVLLPDGDVARFKVRTNVDDKDTPDVDDLNTLFTNVEDKFVMFEANADNVITLGETADELKVAETYDDYFVKKVDDGSTITIAGKRITATEVYTYTDSTVVFNNHAEITNVPGDKVNQEVVTNWNSVLNTGKTAFEMAAKFKENGDPFDRAVWIVTKKDSTKALYIMVDSTYSSSDYELAIVTRKLDEIREGKYEIDFENATDVEVDNNEPTITELTNIVDWVIEYTTKNSKVNAAKKLIDLVAVADADEDTFIKDIFKSGTNLTLATNFIDEINFDQLEVSEVYIDGDDFADITFSAGEDKTVVNPQWILKTAADSKYWTANANFTTLTDAKATTYDPTKTYYVLEACATGEKAVDGAYYYDVSNPAQPAKQTVSVDDPVNTYSKLVKVDLRDVDAKLGTITLDAEELKVYDLRNDKVEEITLTTTENPGFSAIVYKEGATPNVIFIID